jgi:hypothetical protein
MLSTDKGATLEELTDATGWLPHTARAALTGLRKRGRLTKPMGWRTSKQSAVYCLMHREDLAHNHTLCRAEGRGKRIQVRSSLSEVS